MAPFSLTDLGLSDDEIASLGLDETSTTTPAQPAPSDEPEMTPFSLTDLGLSDDEIASLGLDETSTTTPAQPAPSDEPEMAPFSLTDLGLSDDEIASLDFAEAEAQPSDVGQSGAQSGEGIDTPAQETNQSPAPQYAESEAAAPVQPVHVEPPAPAIAQSAVTAPSTSGIRGTPPISNSLAAAIPALDGYLRRLEGDPQNHVLRLSLARVSGQLGQHDVAVQQYRNLIKQGVLLDQVADDLRDLIEDNDDMQILQRLHRVLGDVYSKQGRINEAIEEYSWTFSSH
jgi:tetratricopeptide (TPR) repeat protein